jgi:hypothetical protein
MIKGANEWSKKKTYAHEGSNNELLYGKYSAQIFVLQLFLLNQSAGKANIGNIIKYCNSSESCGVDAKDLFSRKRRDNEICDKT